jgi:NADH:ubiquinone reductase (H+-translocating)
MTDEAAVLLRVSLFGFAAAVVYWSVSYEPLGTAGFLLLGAGPAFAGLYLLAHQPKRPEPLRNWLRRLAGVPPPDPVDRVELAADDLGILPYPSIFPFALGLGLTIALTGLVFGFWPLLLGGGLAGLGAYGWQAAVNREQRHRELERRQPTAMAEAHDPGDGPDEDQAPREGSPVSQADTDHRFVIAGAGYAGLHAALRLATKLRDNPEVDLTLVDRHDYHQVLTELPRVAGGTRAADAVRIPLEEVLDERVRFTKTAVTGFDLADRLLETDAGPIPYTRLVLALGSRPNDFDIPGLRERTLSLYSVEDAQRVWAAANDAVAAAAREPDPERQRRLATVVIGGGGATGVELAGELAEMLPEVARRHGLPPDRPHVILVEAGPTILAGSSPALIDKARRILDELGVTVCTNAVIAEATEEGFRLRDGQLIQGGVFVWAGGVKAPDLVARSGLPVGHNGRVKVDQYLRVLDHPEIYAAGDLASVVDPRTGHVLPPLAQVALEEAETVANNLDAELEGRPLEVFTFHNKGFAVSVGPRRGVADIAGITLGGRLAKALKDAIEWEYRQSVKHLRGWDPLAL